MINNKDNVVIFNDTMKLCSTNEKLRASKDYSSFHQEIIPEKAELLGSFINCRRFNTPANIVVTKKRTLEAAEGYRGERVAVLNFASATTPGGGVIHGANAQEECICRCSTLYPCLTQESSVEHFFVPHKKMKNPIHNDDIIFTPKVTVFKSDTNLPKLLPEDLWYEVDVISCAAPNLRKRPSNKYNAGDGAESVTLSDEDLYRLHVKRACRILDVAAMKQVDTIILGAFGCGAFRNNPGVVAKAYKDVIEDYKYTFKNIEFAVYCRGKDDQNYKAFNEAFN